MSGVGHSHPTLTGTVLQFRQGLEGEIFKKTCAPYGTGNLEILIHVEFADLVEVCDGVRGASLQGVSKCTRCALRLDLTTPTDKKNNRRGFLE